MSNTVQKSRVKLSILILTVPNRVGNCFLKLINDIQTQIGDRNHIEVLGLFDNKKRTLGEKRQSLLDIANGDYVVFIDDDDRVAPTYIDDIMDALKKNPTTDCVVFDCICRYNKQDVHCKYGIEYEYDTTKLKQGKWWGKPAHTMVYKSSIAKKHKYISISNGEDTEWVKRACQEIKVQTRIDKVLYYYDQNNQTSETRGPKSKTTLNKPVECLN